MNLELMENIGEGMCKRLSVLFEKIEVCGSIRRKRPNPKDIDLVAIPRADLKIEAKILKLLWSDPFLDIKDVRVEIYIATKDRFETLKLIRTGSKEHNRMLCSIAKKKGWKLKANGEGLLDGKGNIISNTEEGILKELLGKYVEPEKRETNLSGFA